MLSLLVALLALGSSFEPVEVVEAVPVEDVAEDEATREERLGDQAMLAGRRVEAEAHFRRALELEPGRREVHFKLGAMAIVGAKHDARSRGFGTAAKEFEEELKLDPRHLGALAGRAHALAWTNFVDESKAAFEAWIAAAPDRADPMATYAQFLTHRRQKDEALAVAKRIPQSAPDAVTSLAAVAAEMARHAASAHALEVLDRIPPPERTDRRVVGLRAWALAREFRIEEALAEARRFAAMPAAEGGQNDPIAAAAEEVLEGLQGLTTLVSGRPLPIIVDPDADSERLRPPAGMKPPSTVERIPPEYPEAAKDSGMEGRAVFLILVERSGRIVEVFPQPLRIGARPHEKLFREAALEVIRDWRYHPALDGGQAIPAYVVQRVTFKMPPRPKNWRPHGLPPDPDDPPDLGGGGGIG